MTKNNNGKPDTTPLGTMAGDDHGKGIVATSGNYFPHYTGTTRISLGPVPEVKKLCPRCAAGERNYVHPYRAGGEERICPGVSINPHSGKDGSGIQPKIRNLSERTAVQTDPLAKGITVGKHIGGLVLYWATTRQAVSVHRIDTPSDPTRLSEPYIQGNQGRHAWGREDRQWASTTNVYVQHEPFTDGIVPVMQNPPPPSLPHVIDKRVPKTGASTDGSSPVSPPKPAVVSSDKVDRRNAGAVHSAEQKVEAPKTDNPVPKEEPKAPRPTVEPKKAVVVQNGDTVLSTPKQDDARPQATAAAPASTTVRETPSLYPALDALLLVAKGLPVNQLLLEKGELLKPGLVYSTAFIRGAMELTNIEEDGLAMALALLGLFRAMRLDSENALPLNATERKVASIFAPDARMTAGLLDLLGTPVLQRRSRAEEILANWEREAARIAAKDKQVASTVYRIMTGVRKDAISFFRTAWDAAYARAFVRGMAALDEEDETGEYQRTRRSNALERDSAVAHVGSDPELSAPEMNDPAVKSESSATTLNPQGWSDDEMEEDD